VVVGLTADAVISAPISSLIRQSARMLICGSVRQHMCVPETPVAVGAMVAEEPS
jgi:hypothetical protein